MWTYGIRTSEPRILGPSSWFFVDSAGYLRYSRAQTLVVCGLLGLSGYVLWTIKCPDDHRLNVITEDFGRWELWGVPSTWRSPTTRQLGGQPST
jgi:hypothetical protein